MKKLVHVLIAVVTIASLALPGRRVWAYDPAYNFNFIITDDDLLNSSSFSVDQIQSFLQLHGSPLATRSFSVAGSATPLTAAQIIAQAAQTYTISPKVILTTLQKEESLIDNGGISDPGWIQTHLDWAMGYAVCDSCSTSDPAIQAYKGFANQIDQGTAAFRRYYNAIGATGHTVSGWGPGITKSLFCSDYEASTDGFCPSKSTPTPVTPTNYVTSALYTYTPHFHGNYNFWKIWNRYNFGVTRLYPDGSLLKAQTGGAIYLIQGGAKRRFSNLTALYSRYSSRQIITVPADHLLLYPDGKVISYANYSLLKAPNNGVYLLVDDVKRPITSRAAFMAAGFTGQSVTKASWADLNQFTDGEAITTKNIFPAGQLVQNKTTGGVFYLKDGISHAIYSKTIFTNQFGKQKPMRITAAKYATYTKGDPIGFREGTLVRSTDAHMIYVISNGYRLPITSPSVFTTYRFDWKNVIVSDEKSLWVHPVGPSLDGLGTVQTAGQR